MDSRECVRLGAFILDLHSHELSKAGRPLHLPAQSAKLLALLTTHAPEVVTREEIRRALWGDDLHVEFDAAVNACISQIRSALGDSARSPRFIETIPKRGYRCLVTQTGTGIREPGTGDTREIAPIGCRLPACPEPSRRVPASRLVSTSLALALAISVVTLVSTAGSATRPSGSSNLMALQKYERGVSGLADAGPAELLARVRFFEAAIDADPDFAAAYAGLADAKLLLGAYRVEPPQIAYAAAKAAAQKALALDPGLAGAHAAFGAAALYFEWDWTLARHHLRHAIALDGRSSRAHLWWSRYLTAAGDHPRAIVAARRAVVLAPGSPSALTQLGIAHYYAGRSADAQSACGEARAIMREFVPADACLQAARTGITGTPNLLLVPAINLVRNGDREGAIDWLQRAANRRSDSLIFAAVEPGLGPLRDDPRFNAVLRRVGPARQ
jgi:DNA-binding winged helix-turn-helix (wHTH) protein/Tfp pilus assembly protein PilF